jgi:hypothetical protein
MADKAPKIDDVKKPGKTAPAASSRPLIVTNRPVITSDPMMVAPAAGAPEIKPAEQPLAHTAKVIKPLDASLTAPVTVPGLVASAVAASQTAPVSSEQKAAKTVIDVMAAANDESAKADQAVTDGKSAVAEKPVDDAISAGNKTAAGDIQADQAETAASALPAVATIAGITDASSPNEAATVPDTTPATDEVLVAAPQQTAEAAVKKPEPSQSVPGQSTVDAAQVLDTSGAEAASVPNQPESEQPRPEQSKPESPVSELSTPGPSKTAQTDSAQASFTSDTKPNLTYSTPTGAEANDAQRDPQAEATAEEAAALETKAARDQELEQLVASGKYFVPINAVQRKRSRLYAMLFFLLALVLAAALLDVVLDMGLVQLAVPHTHFFSV